MEIRSAHRVHLRPLPAQGEDIQDELQRTGLSQLLLPGRPPGLVIHHESFLTRLTEVYAIDTTTQTNALSNLHTVLRETVLRRGWRKGRCVRGYRPEHPHFGIQKVTVLLRGRFLTMQDTTSQILPACKRPVWSVHNLIQTPAAPDPSTSKSGPRLFPKR